MPLANGQTLSYYEIHGFLGAGAMGEVYEAQDTRLDRQVAIKVLPEHFAVDDERLQRFEREAKSLASLNHPNVAQIFGVDQVGDLCFLVLELVPGETLAQRIARGALPLEDALDVCRQIAEGLEAAHDSGVIHRDLKPANVRITPDGKVKVLDFGLAKPTLEGRANASTGSGLSTEDGRLLGTPTYMAPEQARGKAIDRRVDIWAFGCVLYECLTAQRAFGGESLSDVLVAVIEREPDLATLPAATPPRVRELLQRCFVKDPNARLRDVGEARLLLADPVALDRALDGAPGVGAGEAPRGLRAWLPWAVAATAVALAAFFALRGGAPAPPAAPRALTFEPKTFGQQTVFSARFLPDGQGLVYSSALTGNTPDVFLLQPGSLVPQRIAPDGGLLLSVSAQGELALLTDTEYVIHRVHVGTLARMTVDGAPRPFIEDVHDADWGPRGELAIARREGGVDRLEYPPGRVLYETSGYISEPRVSADGARVAFLDHGFWLDNRGWVKVVDLDGAVTTLTEEFFALEGLTWSHGGRRVCFSGASSSSSNQLQVYSTGLQGPDVRREFEFPGAVIVLDAADDGRWLMMQQEEFVGVAVWSPGRSEDLDLSWLDQSWKPSLSRDGETLLFTNGHGGEGYSVVTRRLDGSPISTFGEGEALVV